MKKTAKRRPAKKSATKATKAIEEALGVLKKPEPSIDTRFEQFQKLAEINGELNDDGRRALDATRNRATIPPSTDPPHTEEELMTAGLPTDADEWTEYGPLGGQDEDAIAREVLGMDYGFPEEPVVAQEEPSEPSEPAPAQVAPEPSAKASQAPVKAQSKSPVATCILNLIDALNFLHREGHLRKLPEKDILILKQRIKTGRQLIEKL